VTDFPPDVPLALDRTVRLTAQGRVLVGGDPPRALRLSTTGAEVLARLQATGAGPAAAARRLARTLVDGGLAHPRPARGPITDVTIVIPVRERVDELAACLAAAGAPAIVVDDGSRDPAAIAEVCARHGARLVRRPTSGGPAAARNTALAHVDTPLVAFLDSDCIAHSGWLETLTGHFADPLVAAVAPRVHGTSAAKGPVGRFAAARSPIDLADRPARVLPMGRVAYVPAAALVVRRAALGDGFDPRLRYGEDVDLVWRLHDAGWRVRYEPAATVRHAEPIRWRSLVARRYRYGTSAAPLAARHAGRLAPFVIQPWSAGLAALALTGRPRLAGALAATQAFMHIHRLRPAGVPAWRAAAWPLRGAAQTILGVGHAMATLAPAVLLAAAATRRGRLSALVLLASPPLDEWMRRRPALDPVRWTALCLADDAAYGAGVWAGCIRARTLAPVWPAWMDNRRAAGQRTAVAKPAWSPGATLARRLISMRRRAPAAVRDQRAP
jgi:mycofactocin system glycosyltransferase